MPTTKKTNSSATKTTTSYASASYVELNAMLDDALAVLESDSLDVDAAVQAYERVMVLIGRIESHLKEAENKVEFIKKQFGGGAAGS